MDPPADRQTSGLPPRATGEDVRLEAHASGEAVINQAGRDQHHHYSDGVRGRQRSTPGIFGECPYPGLATFDSEQARWFFGRDALIAELIDDLNLRLTSGGMQVVVAPSGAGKSSLLRAGLLPKLSQAALPGSEQWPIVLFTPTAHPVRAFAGRIAAITGTDAVRMAQDLIVDPESSISILDAAFGGLERRIGAGIRLVVVVDQFEELFTLCTDDRERRCFIELLAKVAARDVSTPPMALVVAGVRADFYATCVNYPQLRSALQNGPLVVGPMSETELREAILYPAQDVGLDIEPGLEEVLLRDLGPITAGDSTASSYAADRLPLLAHALRASWQQRHGSTLTVAGYQTTGGIERAIAVTADRAYASLDANAQRMATALFLRLVKIGDNTEDTRRRLNRTELVYSSADPQMASTVLDTFTQVRLLTQGHDTVEITHEALLRSWPLLRRWIGIGRADLLIQQDLEDAAAAWNRRRDTAHLYRGNRLETAHTVAIGPNGGYFSPIAHAFLAASTRQRQRARRLRVGSVTGLVILSVAALIGALMAGINAVDANRQHAVALSRQLAAQSQAISMAQPVTARHLAAAAWRTAHTTEARDVLAILSDQQRYTLVGHTTSVLNVAFSPDGALLASTDADGQVRLWDPTTRQQVQPPLIGHTSMVPGVAFSPDGKLLATASLDKTVRLWDPVTGRQVGVPLVSDVELVRVAFSPDGKVLATAGNDVVQLWDPTTGRAHGAPLSSDIKPGEDIAFSPDGKILATGGSVVQLWDPATGRLLGRLGSSGQGPTGITGLMFSRGGNVLAISTTVRIRRATDTTTKLGDTTVQYWDPATNTQVGPSLMIGYSNPSAGHAMGFSPDGKILAIVSDAARLWDLTTDQLIGPLLDSTGQVKVEALAFSPDGKLLATGVGDAVRLWDPRTGHPFSPMVTGHTAPVDAVAYSPDGNTLATGGSDGVRLWDSVSNLPIGAALTGNNLAFSPNGSILATSDFFGPIRLWDPSVGRPRGPPLIEENKGDGVAFSPDGKILAAIDHKRVLRWDSVTGHLLNPPLMHTESVFLIAFSPDGSVLATASQDEETVRLWEPVSGRLLRTLQTGFMNPGNSSMAFSPDGKVLATADADLGVVRLWDPATGHRIGGSLDHSDEIVDGAAFSPNGKVLATISDRAVRLWDLVTGRLISTQPFGGGSIIAFSPDGAVLATAGDNAVGLWDPATGYPLSPLLTDHADRISAIVFSPDGRTLATASADYTVRLWEVQLYVDPTSTFCAQVGPITEEEWGIYSPGEPLPPPCP